MPLVTGQMERDHYTSTSSQAGPLHRRPSIQGVTDERGDLRRAEAGRASKATRGRLDEQRIRSLCRAAGGREEGKAGTSDRGDKLRRREAHRGMAGNGVLNRPRPSRGALVRCGETVRGGLTLRREPSGCAVPSRRRVGQDLDELARATAGPEPGGVVELALREPSCR